jgi:hypothetical protein
LRAHFKALSKSGATASLEAKRLAAVAAPFYGSTPAPLA